MINNFERDLAQTVEELRVEKERSGETIAVLTKEVSTTLMVYISWSISSLFCHFLYFLLLLVSIKIILVMRLDTHQNETAKLLALFIAFSGGLSVPCVQSPVSEHRFFRLVCKDWVL